MSDNKKMAPKDAKIEILSDEEMEKVTGGGSVGMYSAYTCVNPTCSKYLVYLQFQPPGNECPECGGQMGGVTQA